MQTCKGGKDKLLSPPLTRILPQRFTLVVLGSREASVLILPRLFTQDVKHSLR